MQDGRREQRRRGRAGTVAAAGALCSTELLRAPELSSSADHSRRAPTAVRRTSSHRNIYTPGGASTSQDFTTHGKTKKDQTSIGEEVRTRRGSLLFLR